MSVVEIGRIRKVGDAHYIAIPLKFVQSLAWNYGDHIAFRYSQGKLILERVPTESLGKLKAEVTTVD